MPPCGESKFFRGDEVESKEERTLNGELDLEYFGRMSRDLAEVRAGVVPRRISNGEPPIVGVFKVRGDSGVGTMISCPQCQHI